MENKFKNDLEEGKTAEWWFSECLRNKLNFTDIEFNESEEIAELKKWDIKGVNESGDVVKFEVKYDKKSEQTGNFAVEYYGKNSPSGISTTDSNYWVIISGKSFYIFKTQLLKDFIRAGNFRKIQAFSGNAWCYLIPIEEALQIKYAVITNTFKN